MFISKKGNFLILIFIILVVGFSMDAIFDANHRFLIVSFIITFVLCILREYTR